MKIFAFLSLLSLLLLLACTDKVDVIVKTDVSDSFGEYGKGNTPAHMYTNDSIKNLKAELSKSESILTVNFDYPDQTWVVVEYGDIAPISGSKFAVKLLDKNGLELGRIFTEDFYIPQKAFDYAMSRKYSNEILEFNTKKEAKTSIKIPEKGFELKLPIKANIVDHVAKIEFGFLFLIQGSKILFKTQNQVWKPKG